MKFLNFLTQRLVSVSGKGEGGLRYGNKRLPLIPLCKGKFIGAQEGIHHFPKEKARFKDGIRRFL